MFYHLTDCKVWCKITVGNKEMDEIILRLVNFSEAAKLLKVSRQTIYDWIKAGKLHPLAIGHLRFLDKGEIERLRQTKGNGGV